MPDDEHRQKIAALNDALRSRFEGGQVVMTASVAALSEEIRGQIIVAVQTFNRFDEDNDPYGERDCGFIRLSPALHIAWKIDYYDLRLKYASPDPANPQVTKRVLTIMQTTDW
jgi:hypothetical protein